MVLGEYQFGKADAETEYLVTPIIFQKAFFDSRSIAKKLINPVLFTKIS